MPKGRGKRPERTEFGEPWGWNGNQQNVMLLREQVDSDSESTSTTQSSNSATHVSELASLCVEVVERILSFLSGNDIVACKRVSRWFRDIVDSSVILQYIVECFLAGVVDNPSRRESMQERLESVRRWRAATQHPQWTAGTSSPVSIQAWHSILIVGAVYIVQEDDKIIITQPASKVKGRPEEQWVVDTSVLKFEPYELGYNHNQKLLALVERVDEDNIYRVHMLSVVGSPHPLASTPAMEAHYEYNSMLPIEVDVRIFGSKALLAVREAYNLTEHSPRVWDWQSGDISTIGGSLSSGWGINFLSPHHIITGSVSEGEDCLSAVLVYIDEDIPVSEQYPRVHVSHNTVVTFELPEPAQSAIYCDIDVSCHHPSSQGNGDIFYRPEGRAMVHIWAFMRINGGGEIQQLSFSILVAADAILSLVEEALKNKRNRPDSSLVIPWSKWGYHTRIMDVDLPWHSLPMSGPSTYTFRSPDSGTTYYYDFNTTHAIKADWYSPRFTPRSSLVVNPSKTEQPGYWAHPRVWTSLPYRKHALQMGGADCARLGEDFILTIEAEPDDEFACMTVYSI